MYAIVKTGGKQYRVEQGQFLLVERLPEGDGATVELQPLLFVDGSTVVDSGEDLSRVSVSARVVGQQRGPKLRVVKFKPKRGYKRRTGHRQDLTRIEITRITLNGSEESGQSSAGSGESGASPRPVAAEAGSPEAGGAASGRPVAADQEVDNGS